MSDVLVHTQSLTTAREMFFVSMLAPTLASYLSGCTVHWRCTEYNSLSCYNIEWIETILEDCSSVDVRTNSSRTVGRCAGEEEKPPVLFPTSLRELL